MTYVWLILQQQEELRKKEIDLSILRLYFSGAKELISASISAGLSGNLPSISLTKRRGLPARGCTCYAKMVMEA